MGVGSLVLAPLNSSVRAQSDDPLLKHVRDEYLKLARALDARGVNRDRFLGTVANTRLFALALRNGNYDEKVQDGLRFALDNEGRAAFVNRMRFKAARKRTARVGEAGPSATPDGERYRPGSHD